MASISDEERKRILRERRQAKMAKGKASERLNTILNQGSSVKANSAVSVLDLPEASTNSKPTESKESPSKEDIIAHDDPEIQDIDSVIQKIANKEALKSDSPQPPDMDALFNQIFGGANGASGTAGSVPGSAGSAPDAANADPFTQMMMQMMGNNGGDQNNPFSGMGGPDVPEQTSYEIEMAKYTEYQHQLSKWRFTLVRYILIIANFFWHYASESHFRSSSLVSVRSDTFLTSSFMTWFVSCEVAVLTAYYVLCFSRFQHHVSGNNWIIKLLNMGLMVLPQLGQYKQLVMTLFGYYDLLSIVINDVSLVVVLFGLTSYLT